MLFNSFEFLVFFLCVYTAYVFLDHRWQNRLLLIASYFFYGFWDWRFLSLIFLATTVDYFCAIRIGESKNPRERKAYLLVSSVTDLGILGFFKYFNFFTSNFIRVLNTLGLSLSAPIVQIILPVGISFYTFQTLGYTVDVYRDRLSPSRNFLDYAVFVSFFPQLVAGPIERAGHLLPQVATPRKLRWQWIYEGFFLIFWGLYQKIFIADSLAKVVDPIFGNPELYSSPHIILALYAFAFQIYCDFSGYSHIARGLGRLMGFDIMLNFNVPYLSTNPREFWHRWHISLSTWLRDYLYISLGGSRSGRFLTFRNLLLVMLLGGLWHGAQWTFIVWGLYHAVLLMLHRLLSPVKEAVSGEQNVSNNSFLKWTRVIILFHLICLGWLFFRADSLEKAFLMLRILFSSFQFPSLELLTNVFPYLYLLLIVDLIHYRHNDPSAVLKVRRPYRAVIYTVMSLSLLLASIQIKEAVQRFEREGPKRFIYFQF